MSDSIFNLPSPGRDRLDAYLDEVEERLTGQGMDRNGRRSVVDDVEAQAIDMLRTHSSSPSVEDVEAVLASLDTPDAFADAAGTAAIDSPRPPASATTASGGIPPALKLVLKVAAVVVVGLAALGAVLLFLLAAPAG